MINSGAKPPGVWKTLLEILSDVKTTSNGQNNCKSIFVVTNYHKLVPLTKL